MINHCLNRRSPAHEPYQLFEIGNVRSYILLKEVYCLWDVVQPKKFSAVKTISRYADKTRAMHLKNITTRFKCSEEELLQHIKKSNFQNCYYKIVQQQRVLSHARPHSTL